MMNISQIPDNSLFWREDIDPEQGPYKVAIQRGVLSDPERGGRALPYKLYAPVAGEQAPLADLPVVLWSHGLGGSCEGAAFLGRYIAANGYIVLNIQHPGTDSSLWEGKPGHPWDVIRAAHIPRKTTLDRFRDVPFFIDNLPELRARHPELLDAADIDNLGMSGHSFGAITTQVVAGQKLGKGKRLYSLKENRLRAAIAYSPSPTYNAGEDPARIYGAMDLPILLMTGTEDASPVSGKDYTYRLPIFDHAGAAEKHLLVLEGGDHMVFAGSRGKLAANPKRDLHENIIKLTALAFWDALLKDDDAARNWLSGGGLTGWLGDEAHYRAEIK